MKTGLLIFGSILISLTGCQVMLRPEGELVNTSLTRVEQDHKSVWLIYRDSAGQDYEESGIHKIKYRSYLVFKKHKLVLDFYDLKGTLLDTNSIQKNATYVEIAKNGQIIENYFLDKKGHLINPPYLSHARSKTKYFKDGTWRVRYFNSDNKPSCAERAFEIYFRTDTLFAQIDLDSTVLIQFIELSKRDCNKKRIE